jgi:hypothetical protein
MGPAPSALRLGAAVRLGALLAFAAFGLHQFRYLAAHGSGTGDALAAHGHSYMAGALPYLAALLVAALAATILRAKLGASARRPSFIRRALAYGGAILLVYCCQELLEGFLASGHPVGLDALLADSGWLALPLAVLFGSGAALLVMALEGLETVLSRPRARRRRPHAPRGRGRPATGLPAFHRPSPLAFGIARRPPPAAVST